MSAKMDRIRKAWPYTGDAAADKRLAELRQLAQQCDEFDYGSTLCLPVARAAVEARYDAGARHQDGTPRAKYVAPTWDGEGYCIEAGSDPDEAAIGDYCDD